MNTEKKRVFGALVIGAATLAIGYGLSVSRAGVHCTTKPCTYIDYDGHSSPGTCGVKRGDKATCYCVSNEDKRLSEAQSGCSG